MRSRITFLIVAFFFLVNLLFGQDTTSSTAPQLPDTSALTLDMLKVPASPAFTLMDIAPTEIDEPKVPSDFVTALKNATDNFTSFPRSFAIEFAPAWVFGRRNIDFSEFISNDFLQNLKQSFTVSVGTNAIDNPLGTPGNLDITQVGVGFKVSLLRGEIPGIYAQIDTLYKTIDTINKAMYTGVNDWLNADPEYKKWDDSLKVLTAMRPIDAEKVEEVTTQLNAITARMNQDSLGFQQSVLNNISDKLTRLKAIGSNIKFNRQGFKLDLAGGFVTDFPQDSFTNSKITKVGAWLTGAYVLPPFKKSTNNLSILALARVLGNPDQLYRTPDGTLGVDDNLFFDFGGRLIFNNGSRFSISAEIIGRLPVNNDELETATRYTLNTEYQVSENIVLTFNFGKSFDGVTTEGGNLISALHLFTSFGKRKYKNNGEAAM